MLNLLLLLVPVFKKLQDEAAFQRKEWHRKQGEELLGLGCGGWVLGWVGTEGTCAHLCLLQPSAGGAGQRKKEIMKVARQGHFCGLASWAPLSGLSGCVCPLKQVLMDTFEALSS